MDYLANEDALFHYFTLNTTDNATGVFPEWSYKSMVSGFFECIPVIRANTTSSNSAFNFYTAGDGYGTGQGAGITSVQASTAMRFYNKATNTSGALTNHIPLKSFALKKDIGYTGYWYYTSATSDTTSFGTDNTGGGIFMLPIADNR